MWTKYRDDHPEHPLTFAFVVLFVLAAIIHLDVYQDLIYVTDGLSHMRPWNPIHGRIQREGGGGLDPGPCCLQYTIIKPFPTSAHMICIFVSFGFILLTFAFKVHKQMRE